MSFGPSTSRLVLVGGISGPPEYQVLSDVWFFDGDTWLWGQGVGAESSVSLQIGSFAEGDPGSCTRDVWAAAD